MAHYAFLNEENIVTGSFEDHSFNLLTFRDRNFMKIPDDDGNLRTLDCNERYYTPSEITWLLKTLEVENIEIWGCQVGKFEKRELTVNDFEMLIIGQKRNS